MSAVQTLSEPTEFQQVLIGFPEISRIFISPTQSPNDIRKGISTSIDQGIKAELEQLKLQQRTRQRQIMFNVRSVAGGSLIAALSFFSLATWLFPWLYPAHKSVSKTLKRLSSKVKHFPKRMHPSTPDHLSAGQHNYLEDGQSERRHRSLR